MRQGTWQSNYSGRLNSRLRANTNRKQLNSAESPGMVARRDTLSSFQLFIQYLTVCGYIFFVSMPAIALAIYYTCVWDPSYVNQHIPDVTNRSKTFNNRSSELSPLAKTEAIPQLRTPRNTPTCECPRCPSPVEPEVLLKDLFSATAPSPRTTQKILTL